MNTQPKLRILTDIFFEVVESNRSHVMLFEQGYSQASQERASTPAIQPKTCLGLRACPEPGSACHPSTPNTGAPGTPTSRPSTPNTGAPGTPKWRAISSSDLYRRVMGVVGELRRLGLARGQRVAIMAENRPEWTIADFAILLCGGVTVPIYPTLIASQISFLLRHSGATLAFVSTAEQFAKLRSIQSETFVERIILMDEPAPDADALSMAKIMEAGPEQRVPELDALADAIVPEDLATVIYTSGTTGVPKGAMLTHGNITANLSYSLNAFELFPEIDLAISFLPLSHITARHVDFAELYRGVTIAYCPFIDDLPRIMRELHPTFFVAVPRVYEKIYNKVQHDAGTGIKRRIFDWALSVGRDHMAEVVAGRRPRSLAWRLADSLVYSRVRDGMGGRIRIYASGGAPLSKALAEWYAQMGVVIHEGYGLTETSPVVALNVPGSCKLGTVGRPLANVEVRFAPDGELLVRGPSVFRGYWEAPEETAAAFDGSWFRTGDIGQLDSEGYLSITDRKKDLLKTSGGKFIAPQPIENAFKSCPYVAEAILVGDRRRFVSVIIFPAFRELEAWATQAEIPFRSRADLLADPEVQALYESIVEQMNRGLAQFQQLKKFLLIAEEPSIADGMLTPTLKLRRRTVEARYREEIDKLFADPAPLARSS
jgi:long-chain acyl-CoA synthetase